MDIDHQNAKEHWGQCEQASRKDRTVCLDCLIRGIDGSSCESEQHNSLSKGNLDNVEMICHG